MLKWACSHVNSLNTLSPASSDFFSHLAHFPISLSLVKERGKNCPFSPLRGGTPEWQDYGGLVSHCFLMYWESLSFYLKCVHNRGCCVTAMTLGGVGDVGVNKDRMASDSLDNLDVRGRGGDRVVVDSTDIMEVLVPDGVTTTPRGGLETPDGGGRGGSSIVAGSADVMSMLGCCLENLDVAAGSVGVIIESVTTLLPKVLL